MILSASGVTYFSQSLQLSVRWENRGSCRVTLSAYHARFTFGLLLQASSIKLVGTARGKGVGMDTNKAREYQKLLTYS